MVEAKTAIPHFYVSNEVDMDACLELRQHLNEGLPREQQVRLDAIFVRACALALRAFPVVNASYREGQFEFHDEINIGFAVALPEGLVVPVVRNCDQKGIRQIDQELRPLIERARAGKSTLADLDKGTFSISNLGMYDVTEFSAVVNPPNAAILAIGTTRPVPAVVDGQIAIRQRLKLTLSCDHRIVYGATGAQFLQELKRLLQAPYSLVL
jgi:pyruvate dehydrogenase E2 component (dihydrolipoamide acetyltransferase)